MKQLFMVMTLLIVAGCAVHMTPIPDPQSSEATLYADRCGACHSIPHPKRHTYEQWKHMVEVMDRARDHEGMPALADDEKEKILAYLKTNSR